MKKIGILICSSFLLSCSDQRSNTTTTSQNVISQKNDTVCYAYTNNHRDTVLMHILMSDEYVNGWLSYNYFEKDKNSGTISGKLQGDTLWAEYSFMSEGTNSVREVVFVNKNGEWMQGYGEMKEEGNKLIFTSHNDIVYDSLNLLKQVTCK